MESLALGGPRTLEESWSLTCPLVDLSPLGAGQALTREHHGVLPRLKVKRENQTIAQRDKGSPLFPVQPRGPHPSPRGLKVFTLKSQPWQQGKEL